MQNQYYQGVIMDNNIFLNNEKIIVLYKAQNVSMKEISAQAETITKSKVAPIYNLDTVAAGVVVFAKDKNSLDALRKAYLDGEFELKFYAVCVGAPKVESDAYSAYVKYDKLDKKIAHIPQLNAGAEQIALTYKTIEKVQNISLVRVDASTTTPEFVRFALADIGAPVFGDAVYGGDTLAKNTNTALVLVDLRFKDFDKDEYLTFRALPPESKPWSYFNINKIFKL